ncbi:MAG: ZIP family zinc transporter [Actinomycetota bacterium]
MEMPVVVAAAWGFIAASALPIGALAARWRMFTPRTLGAVLAFGAGTLISAVTFELVEQAFRRSDIWPVVSGLGLGAATFTAGDAAIARFGGRRHRGMGMTEQPPAAATASGGGGGGLPILLGAVLDGIPESLVLGITLATGDAVSITFVVAVFVSNVPESMASTRGMLAMGYSSKTVLGLWLSVAVMSAVFAGFGAMLDGLDQAVIAIVESFAAGALLALIADSLLPDAYRDSGLRTGLFVVLGFALAFALTSLD